MRLEGIDGTHLFGFLAGLGTLALLDEYARARRVPPPRLAFSRDGIATLSDSESTEEGVVVAVNERLQATREFYQQELSDLEKPSEFDHDKVLALALKIERPQENILAGLVCCVGDETFESTLCAANGAGHQCLIRSIRDVLALIEPEHLQAALFAPWRRDYEVPADVRKRLKLGARKPTLRFDPNDERLYALRLTNPTTTDDYKTELGGQALAIPAFGVLPMAPRRRPISVASRREANRVYFEWTLWEPPATLASVRSLLFAGVRGRPTLRARGAFASFRAARVSGDKGMSFAPSEGTWSAPA